VATAWAVAVLLALLAWFGAELVTGAGQAGLAERVLGLAQSGWPCVVVASGRHPVTAGKRAPGPRTGVLGPGTGVFRSGKR
jgi:hypothetical protein